MKIKFTRNCVENLETGKKSRIFYFKDNCKIDGEEHILIYAKTFGKSLEKVFNGTGLFVRDNSKPSENYFEHARVFIPKSSEFYSEAQKLRS